MTEEELAALPYRPCAGIMLANRDGKIFVGQRTDNQNSPWADCWQMPQGGVDKGEDPQAAAHRELFEETGIPPELATILAVSEREHFYDLPDDLLGKIWGGKYRGQRQHWFLMRFVGDDSAIRIDTKDPEFRAWQWVDAGRLTELIVPFKKEIYRSLLKEFSALI